MSSRRNRNLKPDSQPDNGYNFNAGNTGNSGNSGNYSGQPNMNNFGQFFNNMDLNQLLGQISQMMGGSPPGGGFQGGPQMQAPRPSPPRDPRMQLLQAMKPFLNKKRGAMIDGIGQLYTIARIIRGGK